MNFRNKFSVRVFFFVFSVVSLFCYIAIANRDVGTAEGTATVLGLVMLLATAMASFGTFEDWEPDDRPFFERICVSGRAWAGALGALLPINLFLLWFGWW